MRCGVIARRTAGCLQSELASAWPEIEPTRRHFRREPRGSAIAERTTCYDTRAEPARGDVAAIVALHRPDVVKYFGGANVVNGREELQRGLVKTFRNVKMEFIEHRLESMVFLGNTAVETSIFTIRTTPKMGGSPTVGRGRAMVVYVKSK